MTQIKTEKYNINVVSSTELEAMATPDEIEMDQLAKAAVKSAISKAKKCKQAVARYDSRSKVVFIESADGERRYVR